MTDQKPQKNGVAGWFLKKLVTSPAAWIGLAAGIATGISAAEASNLGGGIGFGIMTALAIGFIAFGVTAVIGHAYQHQNASQLPKTDTQKPSIISALESAGLKEDATILKKMFSDRDAIQKRCSEAKNLPNAEHTTELIAAIMKAAIQHSEELIDLQRRQDDPLLDSPERAEERIAENRTHLRNAYQAIANARTRLRRSEEVSQNDPLFETPIGGNLSALTAQLEEETAVAQGIAERMQPDYLGAIIPEGDGPNEGECAREIE